MVVYSFLYHFDSEKQQFVINNDLDSYTVTEMIWDYLEEFEIYNIILKDVSKNQIVQDQFSQDQTIIENLLPEPSLKEVPRTFDVTKEGEYIGMPRLPEFLNQMYHKLGLDITQLKEEQKKVICAQLDSHMKHMWQGLVGQWTKYRKACVDPDGHN